MKKILLALICLFSLILLASCDEEPIDQINSYIIEINQNNDGSLNMSYSIKWEIIDDAGEALTWVEIGVPNKHIKNIKYSGDVSDAYYDDENGDYIVCELDGNYYEGDIVDIRFSFTQIYMYTFDENYIYYEFIPGWFEEIEVKNITVLWDSKNIVDANTSIIDSGNYKWSFTLGKGESINVSVKYDRSVCPNLVVEKPKDDNIGLYIIIGMICLMVIVFVIAVIFVHRTMQTNYYTYRGFSGRHYFGRNRLWYHRYYHGYNRRGKELKSPTIVNSRGSGGGGRSCACACACACAGGGRAGCARKDFYNPNLSINRLVKNLEVSEINEKK